MKLQLTTFCYAIFCLSALHAAEKDLSAGAVYYLHNGPIPKAECCWRDIQNAGNYSGKCFDCPLGNKQFLVSMFAHDADQHSAIIYDATLKQLNGSVDIAAGHILGQSQKAGLLLFPLTPQEYILAYSVLTNRMTRLSGWIDHSQNLTPFSQDGSHFYTISVKENNRIDIWDSTSLTPLSKVTLAMESSQLKPNGLQFNANGSKLLAAYKNKHFEQIDLATQQRTEIQLPDYQQKANAAHNIESHLWIPDRNQLFALYLGTSGEQPEPSSSPLYLDSYSFLQLESDTCSSEKKPKHIANINPEKWRASLHTDPHNNYLVINLFRSDTEQRDYIYEKINATRDLTNKDASELIPKKALARCLETYVAQGTVSQIMLPNTVQGTTLLIDQEKGKYVQLDEQNLTECNLHTAINNDSHDEPSRIISMQYRNI